MKKIFKKKFPIPSWIFAMIMVAYGEILLQLWTAEPLVPGRLLAVGTAEELKAKAGTQSFETAFVSIVKEE